MNRTVFRQFLIAIGAMLIGAAIGRAHACDYTDQYEQFQRQQQLQRIEDELTRQRWDEINEQTERLMNNSEREMK